MLVFVLAGKRLQEARLTKTAEAKAETALAAG